MLLDGEHSRSSSKSILLLAPWHRVRLDRTVLGMGVSAPIKLQNGEVAVVLLRFWGAREPKITAREGAGLFHLHSCY